MKNRLTMSALLACLVWLLHLVVASAQTGITISNADAQWKSDLTTSSELAGVLTNVTTRISFTYSDAGRMTALRYPQGLLNDTTPPTVTDAQPAISNSGQTATIHWTTDEFAKSIFKYGVQPGAYTETVDEPLYTKTHSIVLNGLSAGTTYYFTIASTDRDGNLATRAEASFVTRISYSIYLPTIRK